MNNAFRPGYLSQERRYVKMLHLTALLYNIYQGALDGEVGFEDAHRTLEGLTAPLNKSTQVLTSVLESALWSCNLMNEQGKWWHPTGITFDEFLKEVLEKDSFDKMYNLIVRKKK